MGLFDTTINFVKIGELLEDVDKNPKENIVQFMKKHNIKRLKLGVKEFEIELHKTTQR